MVVDPEKCGYVIYGVCTCDEMACAGEDCPFEDVDQCPCHNPDIDQIMTCFDKTDTRR